MSSKVKKEDRLFSLILALISSREGLTKSEILRTVRGYAELYTHDANPTLDKMFERDKEEIRSMGVLVETRELPEEEGQTHHVRYVISHQSYDFPDNVTFTPEEMTLLNVAAQAWREASLSAESRLALTKMKSFGVPTIDNLLGVAPLITTVDLSFNAVEEALNNEYILVFDYLKPGESSSTRRHVAPLSLVEWNGRWHMLGFDLDAQAQRTFLLSRILGQPDRLKQQTFPRDQHDYAQQLVEQLRDLSLNGVAIVSVTPGTDAQARLSNKYGFPQDATEIECGYSDLHILAEELLQFGADVRVLEPLQLREACAGHFRNIIAAVEGAA